MKILLVPSGNPKTIESARFLTSRLVAAGLDAIMKDPAIDGLPCEVSELALVIPMGGDGTFLSAAHLISFAQIPLLGFNYGDLGFLSGNPERDEVELIVDALSGDIPVERRATLDVHVECGDGSTLDLTALNELAYTRGSNGHVVEYDYSINGTRIARLMADGLVVATATGSTAYALSAGGPIVSPGYHGLVVVPLAPHSLTARAIVTAPSDVLEVGISNQRTQETTLFIDGTSIECQDPKTMIVKRGENEVLFVRGGGDFFSGVSRVFFGGNAQ